MDNTLYNTYLESLSDYKGFIELIRETTANNMDAVENAIKEFQVCDSKSLQENASTFFYLVSVHYFLLHNCNAAQIFARHVNALRIKVADDINPLRQQSLYSMESDLSSLVAYASDLETKRDRIERNLDNTRHKILMARFSMNSKEVKRLKELYKRQEDSLEPVSSLLRSIQSLIKEKSQVIEEKRANECEIDRLVDGRYAVFCSHRIRFTGTESECRDYCQKHNKRILSAAK